MYKRQGKGRRTGQSIHVEYSEPLAAWIFPRQGAHGSYAVDGCARTRFVYFSETIRGRWKKPSHDNIKKKRRTTQAGCTTASTERRAHRTAHFTAARKPTASQFFSAFRRMLLTHSAVVSKAYVEKCREVKRSNDACSVKKTQKRANWQIRERLR